MVHHLAHLGYMRMAVRWPLDLLPQLGIGEMLADVGKQAKRGVEAATLQHVNPEASRSMVQKRVFPFFLGHATVPKTD